MNGKQKSQVNSILAVLGYLDKSKSVFAGSKLIVDSVDALKEKITLISTLTEEQERNQKGKAINKKRNRDLLIESMLGVGGAVRALAIANNDPELAERVKMRRRVLQNLGPKLTERAAKLHELASARAGDLQGLVSAEKLTELADRKTTYEAIVVSPREAIARRKTLTAILLIEVRAAMTLLREVLDPALTIYRESNEEFYLGYRNARNIVGPPTRSLEVATPQSSRDEAAVSATPSRIAEYFDEVPSRATGTNGNGAKQPMPELVN